MDSPKPAGVAAFRPAAAFLSLLAAIMPLAFAVPLFDPYIAAKRLLLVGGGAVVLFLWSASTRHIPVTPLWKPIAALLVLAAISIHQVTRLDTSITLLSSMVIFGVSVSEMRETPRREQLAGLLLAAGFVEAVYVLWQAIAGDPLLPTADLPGKWRTFGTFGNPNWTGEFLAAAILVAVGRLSARFSRGVAAAAVLMTAALGATFARGAWLALVAGLAAFASSRRALFTAPVRRTLAGAAALAAALIAALAFSPDVQRYLFNPDSIRGRIWIWIVSLRMIVEAPFGIGVGNFGRRFPEVQARLFENAWAQRFLPNASFTTQAHNDYLQLIVEMGVLAIPALAVILWMILRRGRSLRGDGVALGFWAAAVSLLVNGLYASPLYLPGSLAIIAILLGAAESSIASFRPVRAGVKLLIWPLVAAVALSAWIWCWHHASAQHRVQKAVSLFPLQAWSRAAVQLQIAERHDPGWIDVYLLLGRTKLAQKQFTVAAQIYQRALTLGPNVDALVGGATALWHAGRYTEAIGLMERLARLRPDLDTYRTQLEKLRAEAAQKEMLQ